MLDKRAVIDVVGTIGVIASLIFVGVQVQQGAAATRSATVLQIKDAWVQLNLAFATSPEMVGAIEKVQREGFGKDPIADEMVAGFYRVLLHNWSNAYYQYQNGTLEESQWKPHVREMTVHAESRIMRKLWHDWSYLYDDKFQALMNSLIAEAPSRDPLDQESRDIDHSGATSMNADDLNEFRILPASLNTALIKTAKQ